VEGEEDALYRNKSYITIFSKKKKQEKGLGVTKPYDRLHMKMLSFSIY